MKKWLFLFPLVLFAANSSSETLFYRLDPTSIPQHLAFTELYGDTVEGRKAQKQLFSLLKGDIELSSFTHLQAALDLFSRQKRSETLLSPQEVETISALSTHLENRKLKGYKATEVDSLGPDEIDLGRALLLTTNPESMESYEAMLDLMALQVLARNPQTPEEKVHAINQLIFHELRLRFPPHSLWAKDVDIYTFLGDVLDSHRGVCLGVSALYLCIAQRIGLELEIITPPGHIYLRLPLEEGHLNIETTARGIHMPTEVYLGMQIKYLQTRNIKEVVGMTFFNQASTLWQADRLEDAIEAYETALRFMPGDPLCQELLGYCYMLNGQIKEGKEMLRPLRNYTPDHATMQNTLIADLLDNKAPVEGIAAVFHRVDENRKSIIEKQEQLENILKDYPKFRAGWHALAITHLQLGHQKQAIQALETHRKLTQDPTTEYYLAALSFERFNYPKAWSHLENAESLTQSDPKALKELRRALSLASPK